MMKENNSHKGFFEHGEFEALRRALPSYLEWGIVRLEVGETRNDEGRTVYLDEELREVFNQQWGSRKKSERLTAYVFLARNGKDMVKSFRKIWDKACEDAGIGKRLFHDFIVNDIDLRLAAQRQAVNLNSQTVRRAVTTRGFKKWKTTERL